MLLSGYHCYHPWFFLESFIHSRLQHIILTVVILVLFTSHIQPISSPTSTPLFLPFPYLCNCLDPLIHYLCRRYPFSEVHLSPSDITVSSDNITAPFPLTIIVFFWANWTQVNKWLYNGLSKFSMTCCLFVLQSYKCEIEDYMPVTYIIELGAPGCSITVSWLTDFCQSLSN